MKNLFKGVASYIRSIRLPDPQVHSSDPAHMRNRELIRMSHLEI